MDDPKAIQQQAAAIARQAWMVKPGQVSDRYRMRIPETMHPIIEGQSPGDRGGDWVSGHFVNNKCKVLWRVLEQLSGCAPSIIADKDLTLIVGQNTFVGEHQVEVLLDAIAHYLPEEEAPAFDLEQRLEELDLLE